MVVTCEQMTIKHSIYTEKVPFLSLYGCSPLYWATTPQSQLVKMIENIFFTFLRPEIKSMSPNYPSCTI